MLEKVVLKSHSRGMGIEEIADFADISPKQVKAILEKHGLA
jgi:DNA-binding CsgD family transcriptional regulator